jgi:Kef-type K+ transport system membrane component KefB
VIDAVLGNPLFLLGLILALGALLGDVAERLRIPWITGCILLGVALGPAAADALPAERADALGGFTQAALAVIAFNIGSELTLDRLRTIGRSVVLLTVAQLLAPLALVLAGETFLGLALPAALILAAVAPATAPTTTYSVIRRRQATGPFIDRALGVLALNDASCVLIFSAVSAGVAAMLGAGSAPGSVSGIGAALWRAAESEALSIAAGAALGLLYLAVRRFIEDGRPGWESRLTAMLLGLVLLSIGGAIALQLSHLLLPLSLGIVVANGVDGAEREFIRKHIKGFEEPLFFIFFVLAGAHLPVAAAENLAVLAAAAVYLACRFAGKYAGISLTASALHLDPPTRRYLGLCFPSQGALAMGLVLAFRHSPAVQQLPAAVSQPIEAAVSIILIGVLLSQLVGPMLIDLAVRRGTGCSALSPDTRTAADG